MFDEFMKAPEEEPSSTVDPPVIPSTDDIDEFLTDRLPQYETAYTDLNTRADPDKYPYRSKYAGRELLRTELKELVRFHKVNEKAEASEETTHRTNELLDAVATAYLRLGTNYFDTEEVPACEPRFKRALEVFLCLPAARRPKDKIVQCLNSLGMLWISRGQPARGFNFLRRAQIMFEHIVQDGGMKKEGQEELEKQHTTTQFLLAQAYSGLGEPKLAAKYCAVTLCKQLEAENTFDELDPYAPSWVTLPEESFNRKEWVRNCSGLSDFFVNKGMLWTAEYLLHTAETVASKADMSKERGRELLAEVQRDLAQFYIARLKLSAKLQSQPEEIADMFREQASEEGEEKERAAGKLRKDIEGGGGQNPETNGRLLWLKKGDFLRRSSIAARTTQEKQGEAEGDGQTEEEANPKTLPPDHESDMLWEVPVPGEVEFDAACPEEVSVDSDESKLLTLREEFSSVEAALAHSQGRGATYAAAGSSSSSSSATAGETGKAAAVSVRRETEETEETTEGEKAGELGRSSGVCVEKAAETDEKGKEKEKEKEGDKETTSSSDGILEITDGVSLLLAVRFPNVDSAVKKKMCAYNSQFFSASSRCPPLPKPLAPYESVYQNHSFIARGAPQAAELFKLIMSLIVKSLEHFKLDGWTTEHVKLQLMLSATYRLLCSFEADPGRYSAMLTRRVKLLKPLIDGLNPRVYLDTWRQMVFEAAEAYGELREIAENDRVPFTNWSRVGLMEEKMEEMKKKEQKGLDADKLVKTQQYAFKSCAHYSAFVESFKKEGKFPDPIETEDLPTFLTARFCVARMYGKMGLNLEQRIENLAKAYKEYEWLTDYGNRHPDIKEDPLVKQELELGAEMMQLLPTQLGKLQQAKARS
uniref:KIF-binding protein n=1 Tax=Chromera velia CCMP2878 TaxID=1169474 RepID=A0A0G4G4X2_9ALVE|eukprot:Cvel_20239.t1-p1 / transcript=Cvel_20239.t1 / gene=Cvel_20239 / organism=Chromera_velia_CCMP2878 / gene_product=KIF1-binding protein homolog, putative / transcript_product=KIF1-binding protein homolog, putative / location=Cvel_scaffold1803:26301-33465(-) / protein_length=872 / sequence_SO=supercontig / SO=protein_coding / is_pseudo=false